MQTGHHRILTVIVEGSQRTQDVGQKHGGWIVAVASLLHAETLSTFRLLSGNGTCWRSSGAWATCPWASDKLSV